MKKQSREESRMAFAALAVAGFLFVLSACATSQPGGSQGGEAPIVVHVDNLTSRVITVDRIVGISGSRGSSGFGNVRSQGERPVTRRVGLVNGQSRRTLRVPWHPTLLAQEMLWLEGAERVASDTETLGPGQHHLSYQVEHCRGQGLNACVATTALHLPPGAVVTLVIDRRHVARLYYDVPVEEAGRSGDGVSRHRR